MFKPNQVIRLWNGEFDIIDEGEEAQSEGGALYILICRNGVWVEDDVKAIEGELK